MFSNLAAGNNKRVNKEVKFSRLFLYFVLNENLDGATEFVHRRKRLSTGKESRMKVHSNGK